MENKHKFSLSTFHTETEKNWNEIIFRFAIDEGRNWKGEKTIISNFLFVFYGKLNIISSFNVAEDFWGHAKEEILLFNSRENHLEVTTSIYDYMNTFVWNLNSFWVVVGKKITKQLKEHVIEIFFKIKCFDCSAL